MRIFSLSKHMKEDYVRKSIEQTYRIRPDVIDLGSAATMDLLNIDSVQKMVDINPNSIADMITKYPTVAPDPYLESSLAKRFKKEAGLSYEKNQFVIFRGVLGGALCTVSLFRSGKYVILPSNIYSYHKTMFVKYGKTVAEFEADRSGLPDLDSLGSVLKQIDGKDVAFVYFYSLYGILPGKKYFERLMSMVQQANVLLVYDADVIFTVYSSNKLHSLPPVDFGTSENLLVLGNLTKEFGAPGIRVSYGITSTKLAKAVRDFQKNEMEMISSIDRSIAKSIVEKVSIEKVRKTLRGRMNMLVNGLNRLGWNIKMPDTGINLFIDVPKSFKRNKKISGSDLFSFYLLSEIGILSRPGCTHSLMERDKIRLVISQKEEKIKEALERMKKNSVTFSMNMPAGTESAYLNLYLKKNKNQRILEGAEKETHRLLGLYDSYRKLEAQILSMQKSRSDTSIRKAKRMRKRLQNISNSIRFQSPIVWMMFKDKRGLLANQPSEKIADFGGFRKHSAHEASSCGLRLDFLNRYTKKEGLDLLDKETFPDQMPVESVYSNNKIIEIATMPDLLRDWKKHEFYEEAGRPCKWKNYK